MRLRALLLAALLLAACSAPLPPPPEAASAWQPKPGWTFARHAVVAAHPLAAEAGLAMLRAGGNAVDAAVAAQLVLGLVEPQSSGLGGGGFLVTWNGAQVRVFDGRETAPAAAREDLFLQRDGRPLPRQLAERSGLAVGVPGLPRLLEVAHRSQGRLPWSQLFGPALQVADHGAPIGPRLHELLRVDAVLRSEPAARALYYAADGQPLPVGTRVRNPAQAALLRRLAREGADAFYRGPVADDLVRRVTTAPRPGGMAVSDLANYQALEREALCTTWRQWRVCGAPPPASGLLTLMQTLKLLDLAGPALPWQPAMLHRYAEAARLAHADRDRHAADPAFHAPPEGGWQALLSDDYLRPRAQRIGARASGAVAPEPPEGGTTHLSVIDGDGMAVALTSSVESAFGTRLLADGGSGLPGGYFLNNQLTDFAFEPRASTGAANRVQPGKRPRSSMAPLLVFDGTGRLQGVFGSPGGLAIPHYVAKSLLLALGEDRSLQAAVDHPNWLPVDARLLLEPGIAAAWSEVLRERHGQRVRAAPLTSGLHLLRRAADGRIEAAADPRREGVAVGD